MLINIFFVFISLVLIITSGYLYRIASSSRLSNPNMISISFWVLGALCFIPSLLILIDLNPVPDVDSDSIIYGNFDNKLKAWILQNWLLIGVPIGAILARFFLSNFDNIKSRKFKNIPLKDIPIWGKLSELTLFNTILCFFIISVFYVFVFSSKTNPLTVALSGGSTAEILTARNTFEFGIGIPLFDTIFKSDTVLLFSLIAMAMSIRENKLRWKILFILMLLFVFLLSIIGGSTGSLIFYIAILVYLRYILIGKLLYFKEFIAILTIVFLSFAYYKSGDDASIKFIFNHIFARAFFDQTKGFYYSLQIFPNVHPHLIFTSSAIWINELFFGTSSLDYGHILMYNYIPKAVEAGYAGHFTSIFITEMWSNFGWPGVLFGPIWVGFVICMFHNYFVKKQKSILLLVLYGHLSIFGFGYFSDFVRFYYPVNISLTYLGPIILLSFGYLFQITFNKNKTKSL